MTTEDPKWNKKAQPIILCASCKRPMIKKDEWVRYCLPCYKKNKGYAWTKADTECALLQQALEDALTRLKKRESRRAKSNPETQKNSPEPPEPPEIVFDSSLLSKKHIKLLLSLCHPDKHKGEERATQVTRWLLSLYKGTR